MLRVKISLTLLAALVGSGAFAAPTSFVTVIGQNDPAIDRQAIQDAIDAAEANSTIELVGTFALDGERILVTTSGLHLVGEAVDDDGDSLFQEDWADGRDNDGDGLIDEDGWETVLRGVPAPGGGPATDDGVNGLFNRALVIEGAEVGGLEVRDLHFTTFHRAIELIPEWASPTGRCDDRVRVDGSVRGVTIERNHFTDNVLGITMLGDVSHSSIRRNVFERSDIFGAVVEGGQVNCPLSGGGSVHLALISPRAVSLEENMAVEGGLATAFTEQSKVLGNVLELSTFGYLSLWDDGAKIERNVLPDDYLAVVVQGGHDVHLTDNRVIDPVFGFDLDDTADQVHVDHNQMTGALVGVYVERRGTGFRIAENRFDASQLVDVLLDAGSTDNVVINEEAPPITVLDFGVGNRLVGNIDLF